MASTEFDPRSLIATSRIGGLATIRATGMPQLSPVTTVYDPQGDRILVSMTAGRAKEANLRRDPRGAIEFTSADGYTWATGEGTATLIGPSTDPDGPEVDALVDYYRSGAGEHPDWREYREVMVSDRRVLLVLQITHAYGATLR
ncbi:PPOX class F420-dependent oxidoreductase [Nocardiopsis tropica]